MSKKGDKPKQPLAFTGDIAAIMAAPDLKTPESHVIRPQDIKAGMYIAVSKWHDNNDAPLGLPMEVLSTALPFLACRSVTDPRPGALDTRDVELMVVSKEYAESFMKQKPQPTPPPQKLSKQDMVEKLQQLEQQKADNVSMQLKPMVTINTDQGITLTATEGESLDDIIKKLIEKYKNNKKKED